MFSHFFSGLDGFSLQFGSEELQHPVTAIPPFCAGPMELATSQANSISRVANIPFGVILGHFLGDDWVVTL